jgi:hypothetical protein
VRWDHQLADRNFLRHDGLVVGARGGVAVALVDHHPAVEREHRLAALVGARAAHPHHAVLAAAVLLLADDLADRAHRVTGIHRQVELHGRVAQVGHGVERDVVHRLAEDHVEDQQVVHGLALVAQRARELRRAVQRVAVAGEAHVESLVALRDGPRHGVHQGGAGHEVFEVVARVRLQRHAPRLPRQKAMCSESPRGPAPGDSARVRPRAVST